MQTLDHIGLSWNQQWMKLDGAQRKVYKGNLTEAAKYLFPPQTSLLQ